MDGRLMDTVLKAGEVARLLKICKASVYRLAREGRIPASRLGDGWRFSSEEIDKWSMSRSLRVGMIPDFKRRETLTVMPLRNGGRCCTPGCHNQARVTLDHVDADGRSMTSVAFCNPHGRELVERDQAAGLMVHDESGSLPN
jgi:excisionase family DNA binding protein